MYMNLISLNTWGGKIYQPLIDFIMNSAQSTDIFCLQEIFHTDSDIKQLGLVRVNLLEELKIVLKDFSVFYFPTLFGYSTESPIEKVDFDLKFGIAVFVKKSLKVTENKNYFIYKDKSIYFLKKDFSNLATPLQHIQITTDRKILNIFNFHGTPFPAAKKDTSKRLSQSKKVKEIIDKINGAKILVGDFNLSLYTKSIIMLEDNMKNLIKDFDVERTRSRLSLFFNKWNFQKYADYTFVSPDIFVKSFEVPKVAVSDHLPMILEFE